MATANALAKMKNCTWNTWQNEATAIAESLRH